MSLIPSIPQNSGAPGKSQAPAENAVANALEATGNEAIRSLRDLGRQISAMSTKELMSMFLMSNIDNMKDLIDMLAKASQSYTRYLEACNDLMSRMTAAQSKVLDNPKDKIDKNEAKRLADDMQSLGFMTVAGAKYNDDGTISSAEMNAQVLSGNLTTISNGVQVTTTKSNQLITELSQANQMLQQWQKFASNTLQGNSRTISTMYNNI